MVKLPAELREHPFTAELPMATVVLDDGPWPEWLDTRNRWPNLVTKEGYNALRGRISCVDDWVLVYVSVKGEDPAATAETAARCPAVQVPGRRVLWVEVDSVDRDTPNAR